MKRLLVLLFLVGALILCSCSGAPGRPTAGSESCLGDIRILSHHGYYVTSNIGRNRVQICGEVQNTGEENLKSIRVVATLYDSENKVIGKDDALVRTDILLPGEQCPFSIIEMDLKGDFDSYALEVTSCKQTTEEPYRDFEFIGVSSHLDDLSFYHVKGSIKNIGAQDIDSLGVCVTFYDRQGKVISSSISTIGSLNAGETTSFDELATPREIGPKIADYTLQTKVLHY